MGFQHSIIHNIIAQIMKSISKYTMFKAYWLLFLVVDQDILLELVLFLLINQILHFLLHINKVANLLLQ